MRKSVTFVLAILVVTALFGSVCAGAADAGAFRPALVITKLALNTNTDEKDDDVFDAFEIVNTSGAQLDLYEYAMFYNGNEPEEGQTVNDMSVVRLTPFLSGDFRDNSTWEASDLPQNPQTCVLEPGETAVVWVFNECTVGATHTLEAFRSYWSLSGDTKVVCWDGYDPADSKNNFDLKNTGYATYGIIHMRDGLADSVKEGAVKVGDGESYISVNLKKKSADFPEQSKAGTVAVLGFNSETPRQLTVLEAYSPSENVRLGTLTDAQKAALGDILQPIQPPTPTGHECKDHLTKVEAKPATCTENGNKAYYKCSECNKLYDDAEATSEIKADSVIEKATGHKFNSEGKCTVCGAQNENEQTGDSFRFAIWFALLAGAACALMGVRALYRREHA